MNTDLHQIEVRGIPIEIVRKDIKNLHLGVYPPNGRVRAAVPLRLDDEAVRLAIVARLGWIRRQQQRFAQQQRQTQREMVSGESHYMLGQRYRLHVIEHDGPPSVAVRNRTTLELRVRPAATATGAKPSCKNGIAANCAPRSHRSSPNGSPSSASMWPTGVSAK